MTDEGPDPAGELRDAIARIAPVDEDCRAQARRHQARLTKPAGSLGRLETLGEQLSAISRQCPPPTPMCPSVAVFAGDHRVHDQGVSSWPQEVSVQMAGSIATGGAVINALARGVGASVTLVDIGLAGDLPEQYLASPHLIQARVRSGARDISREDAMTREEATEALVVGLDVARGLVEAGADLLVGGDMGIANTTASAALIAAMSSTDPAFVTGRGAGVSDVMLTRKKDVIRCALGRRPLDPADPLDVLAAVGGLEHAGLAGLMIGAAEARVPLVIDGVVAGAAALVAAALAPDAAGYWVGGHRSVEPGAAVVLDELGVEALLDLDLRLGEGSGAVLAIPLVQAAARVLAEVATFPEAGVGEAADARVDA